MLRRLGPWALAASGWTLAGVFFASQTFITYSYSRRALTWKQAFAQSLTEWYLWALLAVAILWLARRLPIERGKLWISVPVHAVLSVIFSVVHLAIYSNLAPAILPFQSGAKDLYQAFFPTKFHPGVLTYWAVVGFSHAESYYRRYRDREVRASQLEARLAQAQLQMLKMQLHPHFLFNTLHAISALVHKDAEAADRMIARLSDLLRLTLESAAVQEIPLRQELEFLSPYLEIEQTRFADRLTVVQRIDPATLDALVPSLFLQPLVENAIRHGIAATPGAGRVEIQTRRDGARLELVVRDNGPGLPQDFKEGVGLANTRERLGQLYGADLDYDLRNEGGLAVTIRIPFRNSPS